MTADLTPPPTLTGVIAGAAVIVYRLMPPPPSCAGALQRTVACASPAEAVADAGASGLVTTTVNQGPISPNALENDAPVVVTAFLLPVTVRLVTRPPHCSPVA